MTSNAELDTAAVPGRDEQVQVLLVEDDDGDAILVTDLLREVGAAVVVRRARSLAQAKGMVSGAACVLLDLGLPDSQGLNGLRQLLQLEPEAAIVVLTGEASEHLGELAVRAGYQVFGLGQGPGALHDDRRSHLAQQFADEHGVAVVVLDEQDLDLIVTGGRGRGLEFSVTCHQNLNRWGPGDAVASLVG